VTAPPIHQKAGKESKAHIVRLHVYRSSRIDGMYLYVRAPVSLQDTQIGTQLSPEEAQIRMAAVPSELLQRFGGAVMALELDLWVARKLARVDARQVLKAVAEQGFFLQLPPSDLAVAEYSKR
jgi:uncharacterized protein YcgL (UPF0745 family)